MINHNLDLDSQGKINTLQGMEAKKDALRLYFKVMSGEIPFSTFGNTTLLQIFHSNDESEILDFISDLLLDIRSLFQLEISDYDIKVDRGRVELRLFLGDGSTIEEVM